jgi:hypothetical protein
MMASINTGKVVAGGLLAGLVANAIDFVTNTYILAPDWQALATAHNMDPAAMTSPAVAGTWVAIDFLFGILLVWTYAAMRPRLGAGPKTAILAGLAIYLSATLVVFGFTMMGLLTMTMFAKGSIASIVSTLAASVAGAAVYKEADAPAGASAYAR